MGMLLHHTWQKQQEEAAKPTPKAGKPVNVEEPTPVKDEPEPAKKTAGRRKVSK